MPWLTPAVERLMHGMFNKKLVYMSCWSEPNQSDVDSVLQGHAMKVFVRLDETKLCGTCRYISEKIQNVGVARIFPQKLSGV